MKGGDIDLLIVVEDEPFARKLSGRRFEIITDFKKNISDRRIDLSIRGGNLRCEYYSITTGSCGEYALPAHIVVCTICADNPF